MLQVCFDGYARQVQSAFTSALRTLCQVNLAAVEQGSYAEYVESLDTPTCITVFTADPITGSCALEMPLSATMTCIDLMLGGPGGPRQPIRPLTEIESSVVRGLMERLLAELRHCLLPVVALDPVPAGVEYDPLIAQVAGAADAMVTVTLELRLAEAAHRMTLCLPLSGLLPHLVSAADRAAVSEREHAQRERASEQVQRQLQHVPVDVTVRFRPTRLTPAEISGLRVGDIVRLAHPASAALDVTVDDTTFAHATAGAHGQRLAALVVALPEKETQ